MIDHAALKALVVARGGNPDCLHCSLSTWVGLFAETHPEGRPHAVAIAGALAETIGDLIAPAPPPSRESCLAKMVGLMRERFDEPAAPATVAPSQLH